MKTEYNRKHYLPFVLTNLALQTLVYVIGFGPIIGDYPYKSAGGTSEGALFIYLLSPLIILALVSAFWKYTNRKYLKDNILMTLALSFVYWCILACCIVGINKFRDYRSDVAQRKKYDLERSTMQHTLNSMLKQQYYYTKLGEIGSGFVVTSMHNDTANLFLDKNWLSIHLTNWPSSLDSCNASAVMDKTIELALPFLWRRPDSTMYPDLSQYNCSNGINTLSLQAQSRRHPFLGAQIKPHSKEASIIIRISPQYLEKIEP